MRIVTLSIMVSMPALIHGGSVFAQETVIGDPGQPNVTYHQAPPVVPNPRKEAYERKQQEKARKARQDADAAKRQQQAVQGAQAAPEPVIRRYDPTVRDAITGKEIKGKKPKKGEGNVQGAPETIVQRYNPVARDAITGKEVKEKKAPPKKQTANQRISEKYKKRRDARK